MTTTYNKKYSLEYIKNRVVSIRSKFGDIGNEPINPYEYLKGIFLKIMEIKYSSEN